MQHMRRRRHADIPLLSESEYRNSIASELVAWMVNSGYADRDENLSAGARWISWAPKDDLRNIAGWRCVACVEAGEPDQEVRLAAIQQALRRMMIRVVDGRAGAEADP